MKTSKTTFMIFLILMGSIFISSTNSVSAVGQISTDVLAGDVYWYKVNSFPTFQELIDLSEINEGSNETLSATGGLSGSSIYAKVISTQSESMKYYDGSIDINAAVPTVDLAVGMITGNDISFSMTNNTSSTELGSATLPSGAGLPFPMIFGTTTYFNVSNMANSIIPIPLILNDDYTTHGAVISELSALATSEGVGTISFTDDSSKFQIDFDLEINENESVSIKGLASWSKTNGVAQALQLTFYNSTTNVNIITTIDISLDKSENIPVSIEVGDKFDLTVAQAGFDFTTAGFPTGDDPYNELNAIKNNFTALEGENLLELEVVETQGMYYRVEGTAFNGTGNPRISIPEAGSETWMVGFGRMGPVLPIDALNDNNDMNNNTNLMLNSIISQHEKRMYSPSGFVVSKDYAIYSAWDKTMSFAVSSGLTAALKVISEIEEFSDPSGEFLDIKSSTTEDPILLASYTGGETTDGGYSSTFNINWDFIVDENRTIVDGYYNNTNDWVEIDTYWQNTTVISTGAINAQEDYTVNGDFDFLNIDGYLNFELIFQDENGTSSGKVSISNFNLKFDGNMTRINPITTTTVSTSGSTNSTIDAPGDFALPGFEFGFAIIAFSFVTLVIKRKRA